MNLLVVPGPPWLSYESSWAVFLGLGGQGVRTVEGAPVSPLEGWSQLFHVESALHPGPGTAPFIQPLWAGAPRSKCPDRSFDLFRKVLANRAHRGKEWSVGPWKLTVFWHPAHRCMLSLSKVRPPCLAPSPGMCSFPVHFFTLPSLVKTHS